MTEILERQLDTYEQSARSAAADGTRAPEVEQLIEVGTKLYEAADKLALRWRNGNDTGRHTQDDRDAAALESLYRRMDRLFDLIGALVDSGARRGELIPSADAFTDLRMSLKGVLSIESERVALSLRHLAEGRHRTMAEVRDGLRRHLVAGS